MPEWLIWVVAIWFACGFMGRCSWNRRPHRIRGPGRSRADLPRSRPRPAAQAPSRPEEAPEERIRRRFVEGRITLDEYEAELWEVLRPDGPSG